MSGGQPRVRAVSPRCPRPRGAGSRSGNPEGDGRHGPHWRSVPAEGPRSARRREIRGPGAGGGVCRRQARSGRGPGLVLATGCGSPRGFGGTRELSGRPEGWRKQCSPLALIIGSEQGRCRSPSVGAGGDTGPALRLPRNRGPAGEWGSEVVGQVMPKVHLESPSLHTRPCLV